MLIGICYTLIAAEINLYCNKRNENMMNTIGLKIKELRIAENLTQENLATELNVSFQSISRWENGISTPDISLIPIIARYFGVSTDFLFGLLDEEAETTKTELEQLYWDKRNVGDIEGAYEIMLEGRKSFPRNTHFCVCLAEVMNLYESGTSSQIAKYAEEGFSQQIFHLCEKVVEESKDEADRFKALSLLASYYAKAGNMDEAIKIANTMSDLMNSKEVLLGNLLTGEDKKKRLQENLLMMTDYISDTLVKIAFRKEYGFSGTLSLEEKLDYVIAANSILKTIITDGNYLVYSRKIGWNYRRIAELYAALHDKEHALEYLLEAEKMAAAYDSLNWDAKACFTAPFCNLVENSLSEGEKCFVGSEREMLAYRLDEMKDYFGDDEAFRALRNRLGEQHIVL